MSLEILLAIGVAILAAWYWEWREHKETQLRFMANMHARFCGTTETEGFRRPLAVRPDTPPARSPAA